MRRWAKLYNCCLGQVPPDKTVLRYCRTTPPPFPAAHPHSHPAPHAMQLKLRLCQDGLLIPRTVHITGTDQTSAPPDAPPTARSAPRQAIPPTPHSYQALHSTMRAEPSRPPAGKCTVKGHHEAWSTPEHAVEGARYASTRCALPVSALTTRLLRCGCSGRSKRFKLLGSACEQKAERQLPRKARFFLKFGVPANPLCTVACLSTVL